MASTVTTTIIDTGGLLFDLDGTLVDSIASVEAAWRLWSESEGIHLDAIPSSHGRTAYELLAPLVPPDRLAAAVAALSRLEQNSPVPVLALQGTKNLLQKLPNECWAVVTSARRDVAQARLRSAGLTPPKHMVTAEDVQHGKPDPEAFVRGVTLVAQRNHPCAAFEDSVAGLRSARAAGCYVIAVTGTTPYDILRAHADTVINSLNDVIDVVVTGDNIRLTLHDHDPRTATHGSHGVAKHQSAAVEF